MNVVFNLAVHCLRFLYGVVNVNIYCFIMRFYYVKLVFYNLELIHKFCAMGIISLMYVLSL